MDDNSARKLPWHTAGLPPRVPVQLLGPNPA